MAVLFYYLFNFWLLCISWISIFGKNGIPKSTTEPSILVDRNRKTPLTTTRTPPVNVSTESVFSHPSPAITLYTAYNISTDGFPGVNKTASPKRKKVYKRIIRRLLPKRRYHKGALKLRRKKSRSNKVPDNQKLLNEKLKGRFPLHTANKDINIYNSYGNRAIYYRIYNGKWEWYSN